MNIRASFKDNFSRLSRSPKERSERAHSTIFGYVKNLGENRDDDDNARVGKRERTGATVFMDMVVNMLTGFGMCVVCVRKYACVCVFTFLGLLGDHWCLFPYLSKGGQSRFGTFVSKSWFKV